MGTEKLPVRGTGGGEGTEGKRKGDLKESDLWISWLRGEGLGFEV